MDFLTLPDLACLRIFSFMDADSLLQMKLVCRSWRDLVCRQGHVWRALYVRDGGSLEGSLCRVCHPSAICPHFHHLYLFVRSVRAAMREGRAFGCVKKHSRGFVPGMMKPCHLALTRVRTGQPKMRLVNSIAYAQTMETYGKDWYCAWRNISQILRANRWGHIHLFDPPQGEHLRSFFCTFGDLTDADEDPSGRYVLVGDRMGVVGFFEKSVKELFAVKLNFQDLFELHGDITVKKVFFLPPPPAESSSGRLFICICRTSYVTLALVELDGGVAWERSVKPSINMASFCRCRSDPSVLYAALTTRAGERAKLVRFSLAFPAISHEEMIVSLEPVSSRMLSPLLLLAAGRRFLIAVHYTDIVIFDLKQRTKVGQFRGFTDGNSVELLTWYRRPTAVLAWQGEWLDGLTPSCLLQDKEPFIVAFGQSSYDGRNTMVKYLVWSVAPALKRLQSSLCQEEEPAAERFESYMELLRLGDGFLEKRRGIFSFLF